ncbi:MAG TPA: hybrid sensor histidine kinase/response regulator, partial [Candidatus Coatesbacteria bacterium]|nr:hybrid sensor histidine kinase/response regulator [Candidatus Coatesbacteria bacterium]
MGNHGREKWYAGKGFAMHSSARQGRSSLRSVHSVLVIDDERRMCDSIRILLEQSGYRVDTAGDGAEGIVRLREYSYDLVIADLMMPRVDGFGVLEYVSENLPHTLVIVITGYSSMRSSIEALRRGAYDYLVKPFDFDILKLAVEKAMDRIRLQRLGDDFISMITHDLKNPLTSVMGYCSLILSGAYGEPPESLTEPLSGIATNADRMLALINDFLAMNKFSSEGVRLDLQRLQLNSLVAHLVRNVAAQLEIKQLSLRLNLDEGLHPVMLDPIQIERVINNLLSNAIKFTPRGGELAVCTGQDPDFVFFSVSDTGPGIPPEQQAHLFEKYKRGSGSAEGTGLGLF